MCNAGLFLMFIYIYFLLNVISDHFLMLHVMHKAQRNWCDDINIICSQYILKVGRVVQVFHFWQQAKHHWCGFVPWYIVYTCWGFRHLPVLMGFHRVYHWRQDHDITKILLKETRTPSLLGKKSNVLVWKIEYLYV